MNFIKDLLATFTRKKEPSESKSVEKIVEYYPEVKLDEYTLTNKEFKIQDLFDVYIDKDGNVMLKAKTKVYFASDDDIGIISKKDITLISGNALGHGEGYISFNPLINSKN